MTGDDHERLNWGQPQQQRNGDDIEFSIPMNAYSKCRVSNNVNVLVKTAIHLNEKVFEHSYAKKHYNHIYKTIDMKRIFTLVMLLS
ncbi:MAG: hypothetical protein ABIR81_11380, partial [Ginsengibacter sp.]